MAKLGVMQILTQHLQAFLEYVNQMQLRTDAVILLYKCMGMKGYTLMSFYIVFKHMWN